MNKTKIDNWILEVAWGHILQRANKLHFYFSSIATGTFSNDIAIIKLRQPIVFSKNVYAATLPTSDIPADTNCTVIGWGKTHVDRKYLKT